MFVPKLVLSRFVLPFGLVARYSPRCAAVRVCPATAGRAAATEGEWRAILIRRSGRPRTLRCFACRLPQPEYQINTNKYPKISKIHLIQIYFSESRKKNVEK